MNIPKAFAPCDRRRNGTEAPAPWNVTGRNGLVTSGKWWPHGRQEEILSLYPLIPPCRVLGVKKWDESRVFKSDITSWMPELGFCIHRSAMATDQLQSGMIRRIHAWTFHLGGSYTICIHLQLLKWWILPSCYSWLWGRNCLGNKIVWNRERPLWIRHGLQAVVWCRFWFWIKWTLVF
jgi:hypothetical protein